MNRHPTEAMRLAAEALRPLANAVFNDNGDMSVSIPIVSADECIAAYFAAKRLSAALAVEAGADTRSLAVEIVDMIHGCTMEYSSQPAAHADEYDRVEEHLNSALTTSPASSAVEGEAVAAIGYASAYGLDKLASKAHHYCLSLTKKPENEFQCPIYAPTPAGEWRTIDSAPKDQMVLVVDVNWPPALQRDAPPPIKVGYLCTSMLKWHIFGASWTPTHWMPLPASPAPQTEDRA